MRDAEVRPESPDPHRGGHGHDRRVLLAIAAVLIVYLALAGAMAFTRRPWVDEAWFAVPAWNLLTRGVLATTNLETAGTWLTGIDQYTYWITPLHMLVQAGWYTVFGFSVVSLRSLSIVWGFVALASLFTIVSRLTGERRPALLAMAIVATDYLFIRAAGDGRMDMMSAALGLAGLAAYLSLRHARFDAAVVAGHASTAASLLTHPYGALPAAALAGLTLFFDRRRLQWRHLILAALPYLVGFSAWGLYIAQAPALFLTQFGGNMAGEPWTGLGSWFASIWNIYAAPYGLLPHWAGPAAHARALVLVFYLAGLVGVLTIGTLRRRRGVRALLLLWAIYFALMSLGRRESAHEYLVHIIPFYAALLAIWLDWAWSRGGAARRLAAASCAALILLQVGGVGLRARTNTYARDYHPVVEYLRTHAGADDLIMGSAELGFAIGFTDRLLDDVRLGFYSRRHPEYVVVEDRYRAWFTGILGREPAVQAHVAQLLTAEFDKAYEQGPYTVYRCRRHEAPTAAAATPQ